MGMHYCHASIYNLIQGDVCMLGENGAVPQDDDISACVLRARTVIVFLTAGTLESRLQLITILMASEQHVQLIPILTPTFVFPNGNQLEKCVAAALGYRNVAS